MCEGGDCSDGEEKEGGNGMDEESASYSVCANVCGGDAEGVEKEDWLEKEEKGGKKGCFECVKKGKDGWGGEKTCVETVE